ncbi:MAG: helix-turn-helix transcriptional regulator [Chloroflexi bacterium]|uniref:Helix-turn-helix domain-containing protein n=1 Tax=Candidatus Chlorohelix allophototropha TaxID=3003348 RepID=A0A8T7M258_9CHLR|nr:helix-turn-helix transcriptional regulator [Chloroflexota bacterium]WJW65778.1 helix-turn-helix domain-containing protein [Chloroflexota bacterium L227-S17]
MNSDNQKDVSPKDAIRLWVQKKMLEQNLGVNQLAEYSEISSGAISNLLNGKRLPAPKTLTKLAQYFKHDPDHLLALAGYRSSVRPEDSRNNILNPDLRTLVTAETLNNIAPQYQRAVVAVIQTGLKDKPVTNGKKVG